MFFDTKIKHSKATLPYKNWGTLNVRVIPERKELWDKDGGRWISETDIISKVGG